MRVFYILLSVVGLLLASCGPINFSSQEIACRYNADDDSLTVRLVYNEVQHVDQQSGWFSQDPPTKEPDLERGEKSIRRMLNGDRVFMVAANLLHYDLDDTELEKQSEFQRGISVESVLVELDDKQRLRITQELKFGKIAVGMKMANEEMRREMKADIDGGKMTPEETWLDQATIDLLAADIQAGRDWMSWDENGLQFSIPASPALLARAVRDGLHAMANFPEEEVQDIPSGFDAMSKMLGSLTAVTVQDHRLHLTFGPGENGWTNFIFKDDWKKPSGDEAKYPTELLEHLKAQGMEFPAQYKAPTP